MKTYKVTLNIFGKVIRDTVVAESKEKAVERLYRPYCEDILKEFEKEKIELFLSKMIPNGIETGLFKANEIPKLERKSPYYVSIYVLYPIYEAADGGYYYPGTELHESRPFQNRKDAIRYINKLYKRLKSEPTDGTWTESSDHLHFGEDGRYIGNGWFAVLERKLGSCESGWVPYC